MLIKHIYGKGLNFDLQLRGVIEELGHVRNVVRLVFFVSSADFSDYYGKYESIARAVNGLYPERPPVFSCVAQDPLNGSQVVVEVHGVCDRQYAAAMYKKSDNIAYKDGLVHYDWHWLWHWGTGEALNNGTHEVDVARWGLGVEFPTRVSSLGGRYAFKDDWETPDTQTISIEFPENKMIVWEGRSCNKFKINDASRGVVFYGDKGTIFNPGGNSYTVYDMAGKVIKDSKDASDSEDTTNIVNAGDNLAVLHVANFLDSIRNNKKPNADCEIGHRSTLLVQLGNISWRTGQTLDIDPKNGHILNNKGAQKLWGREYAKGWEPKV